MTMTERFNTKKNAIVLDITYECNMSCPNCDRRCDVAPGGEVSRMTLEQVRKFIEETKELGITWSLIKLSGGEPVLHPDFIEIIALLESLRSKIIVLTNGILRDTIPHSVSALNSKKNSNRLVEQHVKTKMLPVDVDEHVDVNTVRCFPLNDGGCSTVLNTWGYYLTSPCSCVDRIFGFDVGVKTLREVFDTRMGCFHDQKLRLCDFCGHALGRDGKSQTLKDACDRFLTTQLSMTKY